MNLTEQEIEKLKATKSANEWNSVCDEIKKARDGRYPPDWWPVVMVSGMATEIQNSWKSILS